jgi:hypothetical protein
VTQAAKVHPSAKSFVDPRVRETKVTTEIINKIYGFFPLSSKLISGYLDEEQLYWKVNYHWEYSLEMIEHSEKLPLDDKFTKALHAIKNVLESNKPDPARGYRLSNVPEDSHVHVEFKNGVIVPGTSNVGVQQGRQGAAMKVQSNQQHAIHRYQ